MNSPGWSPGTASVPLGRRLVAGSPGRQCGGGSSGAAAAWLAYGIALPVFMPVGLPHGELVVLVVCLALQCIAVFVMPAVE